MSRFIPLLFLALALPSTAQQFGPERPVSTITPRSFTALRHHPAAASNGDVTLVVWSDGHTGNTDVHGTLVGPDLASRDAFPIAPTSMNDEEPSVAAHHNGFVVAWASRLGMHAATVSAAGVVRGGLIGPGLLGTNQASVTAIASNGTRILFGGIIKRDTTAELQLVSLDAELNIIRVAAPITGFAPGSSVAITTTSDGFLVAASHDTRSQRIVDIYRVSIDGSTITKVAETLAHRFQSFQSRTELTFSSHGTGFLLAVSSPDQAAVVPISLDGAIAGFETSLGDVSPLHAGISIVFEGGRHVVATIGGPSESSAPTKIQITLVDSSGSIVASSSDSAGEARRPLEPQLVLMSDGVALFFTEGISQREVLATKIRTDLSTTAKVEIGRTIAQQLQGDSAFDGENFVTAWTEGSHLLVGRMSPDGTNLSGGGTIVGSVPSYISEIRPRVACNDSGCAVAWTSSDGKVLARRLTRSHQLRDELLEVTSEGGLTDIVASGETFLVLWARAEGSGISRILRQNATILRADGLLQQTQLAATTASAYGSFAGTAVWTGNHYLVVWEVPEGPPCNNRFCYNARIVAATMHRNGETLGKPVTIAPHGTKPQAAIAGNRVLIAFMIPRIGQATGVVVSTSGEEAREVFNIPTEYFELSAGPAQFHTATTTRSGSGAWEISVLSLRASDLSARSTIAFPNIAIGFFSIAANADRIFLLRSVQIALLPEAHSALINRLVASTAQIREPQRKRSPRD